MLPNPPVSFQNSPRYSELKYPRQPLVTVQRELPHPLSPKYTIFDHLDKTVTFDHPSEQPYAQIANSYRFRNYLSREVKTKEALFARSSQKQNYKYSQSRYMDVHSPQSR